MSPTSTSDHRAGDVVLVDVPYTDLTGTKKRPAVVLLSHHPDILAAFCTSRLDKAGPDDVLIPASPVNGLAVDSVVLPGKLFTLHQSLIVRRLGRLTGEQHRSVVARLVRALDDAAGAV